MVGNFLNGGAAINVFCRQHQLPLWVVDAGVNHDFAPHPRLIEAKIKHGTANMLHQAAMRVEECQDAIERGAAIVRQFQQQGCNTLLLGEMGIGNTAAASLLLHKLTDWPLADCVGKGAGLDDAGLQRKQRILQQVLQYHAHVTEPLAVLATFGGLELAMLVGAYGQAAELRMVCVVDGFIASVAVLVAAKRYPAVLDYCLFAHQSAERGHQALLRHLNANPLLSLDLRLGEASGAVLAYPLLQAALLFLTEMHSFEQAGVSHQF
jgi:nicotinate-nucleotide--dimethylbenzimidazole phosphoribosyltransferase